MKTSLATVIQTDQNPFEVATGPLYRFVGQEWVRNDDYDDEEAMGWLASELASCAADPFYFVTHYCCGTNEHLDDQGRPPTVELFPSWPFVKAFYRAWSPSRDTVVEKSRDMMASWMSMAGLLHDLLFRKNWAAMTLSRVESLVDDGGTGATTDSLHGKILFLYQHLPPFFREACPLEFRYLQIRNEQNRSHVTGFSATPSAGRGPKWKRAVLDEFAWVPWSEGVMASVARACPNGKYLISTPNGKNNAFFRIREAAASVWPQPEKRKAHWQRLTIHWSQHPKRDASWREQQRLSHAMTEEALAQEIDISYTRSIGRRVYPRFLREQHVAGGAMARSMTADYDPIRPLYVCCDFNADPLVWELVQPHPYGATFRVIGEICRRNAIVDDAVLEFFVRFGPQAAVMKFKDENPMLLDVYGQNGVCQAGLSGHLMPVYVYGDATEEKSTVHNRVKTYQRIAHQLRAFGFQTTLRVPPANPPIRLRIETVNDALGQDLVLIHPRCEQLIRDFEEGHWNTKGTDMDQSEDDDGSGLSRSHASSAMGYMLVKCHKVLTSAQHATWRKDPENLSSQIVQARHTYSSEFIRSW